MISSVTVNGSSELSRMRFDAARGQQAAAAASARLGAVLEIAAVVADVDPGEHDLAVAPLSNSEQGRVARLPPAGTDRLATAHRRDDAVRAGQPAAFLDLEKRPRPIAEVQRRSAARATRRSHDRSPDQTRQASPWRLAPPIPELVEDLSETRLVAIAEDSVDTRDDRADGELRVRARRSTR